MRKVQEQTNEKLQWHPAFFSGIQIELQKETENLIFENEHQLGKKPFGIDVLVVKKEKEKPIEKNIGRIFRKYNIIEYKSPKDYLSIDDFYKTYGYACFYKADAEKVDGVRIGDVTISFVCRKFPKKMVQHLWEERNYKVEKQENGIYYIIGDKILMQLIVTKELSKTENLWLWSLTDDLEEKEDAKRLIQAYNGHEKSNLYQSVMNMIVKANQKKFEEEKHMCQALKELFREEIEEEIKEEMEGKMKEELEAKGLEGENKINTLNAKLAQSGRISDIIKASEDRKYQMRLLKEFGM